MWRTRVSRRLSTSMLPKRSAHVGCGWNTVCRRGSVALGVESQEALLACSLRAAVRSMKAAAWAALEFSWGAPRSRDTVYLTPACTIGLHLQLDHGWCKRHRSCTLQHRVHWSQDSGNVHADTMQACPSQHSSMRLAAQVNRQLCMRTWQSGVHLPAMACSRLVSSSPSLASGPPSAAADGCGSKIVCPTPCV